MRIQVVHCHPLVESYNHALFRTIVETANEGIWLIDPEARTRYMNARMAEILGYRPEEVTDLKVSDTWFPGWRARERFNGAITMRWRRS